MSDALSAPDLAGPDLSGFVRPRADGEEGVELLVRGARCAACLRKIETGVGAVKGVSHARLNLTTGRLSVSWPKGRAAPGDVVRKVEDLGYGCAPFDPAESKAEEDKEGRKLALALGVAAFGAGNVMMFSVPAWTGLSQELGVGGRTLMYWASALIAAPCALYAGTPFFASAWASLRRGKANMDVPISVAVLLTLLVSFSETMRRGPHAYFDAAVSLLFLLLIGRYLDHKLRVKAKGAARDLLALQAPVALRVGPDGVEHGAPVREIAVGDLVAVRPGERVPVDGVVETGASDLDLSLVTGETLPARTAPGARIAAGALALTGRLVVRAVARAEDSTLAEIARLMEAGAQSKSRYVRLADRAASIYVPTVHTLAALTFAGWWIVGGLDVRSALLRAVAVLIVTCPCALGLAVPAVQITASGRLFRRGVLVKSGAALERLAEVDTVIFDKTGVLTEGRPRLIGADAKQIARAAPLARASRHVLSRALAGAAGPGPAAPDAHEVAGEGVEAIVDGKHARLGRASFVGAATETAIETELWLGVDGEAPVRFAFADSLRPDAAETVAALKTRGLDVRILSGDIAPAVQGAAEALGVADWRAAMTPAGKAEAIAALAAAGHKALFVGDGLNDAAALSKAHASMAPGSAADASQNAADLVFTGEALGAVVEAVDTARAARRRALQNFGFSAVYNVVAAPAAIFGLVTPLIAALAMSGSSLVVTLNALRMVWGGRRP